MDGAAQVVENARPKWTKERADLADRISFSGGDFFDANTIPEPGKGKTVYIMRSILHDWDDASSLKILQSLAVAMKGSPAKLVLVEQASALPILHAYALHPS